MHKIEFYSPDKETYSISLHYGKAAMANLESFCLTKTNSTKNKAPSGLTLSGGINSKNILFDAI